MPLGLRRASPLFHSSTLNIQAFYHTFHHNYDLIQLSNSVLAMFCAIIVRTKRSEMAGHVIGGRHVQKTQDYSL